MRRFPRGFPVHRPEYVFDDGFGKSAAKFGCIVHFCGEKNFGVFGKRNFIMASSQKLEWVSKPWPMSTITDCAFQPLEVDKDNLIDKLMEASEHFPIDFPIQTVRLKELQKTFDKATLERNIASTYPVLHERALVLFLQFLEYKSKYGTDIEKQIYKDMTVLDLVDRMLLKRSVTFCGPRDAYMLLSKEENLSGWENVGKMNETSPLVMKDCLTYDEMKLSALLSVSGRTVFINIGDRRNAGIVDPDPEKNVEKSGIIVGLIGTRLEKRYSVEYEECIITPDQNTINRGFGLIEPTKDIIDKIPFLKDVLGKYEITKAAYEWRKMWFVFYNADSLTFEEANTRAVALPQAASDQAKEDPLELERERSEVALVRFPQKIIFNNELYFKRLSLSFDVLLLEANDRAKEDKTTAYVHVVGIGLGVWRIAPHQSNVFVRTLIERIRKLMPLLHSVSDVHLAYIYPVHADIAEDGSVLKNSDHPLGGIKIHISERQPSSKLIGDHKGKLLVESYAWNGNSLPGNDFWMGNLTYTGDPAAACSTQVAELHNSQISRAFVSGRNLHVASQYGVKHVADYCALLQSQPPSAVVFD